MEIHLGVWELSKIIYQKVLGKGGFTIIKTDCKKTVLGKRWFYHD